MNSVAGSDFRDAPSYVGEGGKRVWVYPKKPSGYFHNLRIWVTLLLLSILFAGPFVKVGGQPLLLLNFFERKFIIFGQVFWPQDTHLLIFLLLIFFVFIILFTVVFGRVWCGWACPQTLFMEMVFRKIEYWIEGDYTQQRRLNSMPWNTEKIGKKGAKLFIFLLISLLISHTVMAYLIGWEDTLEIISQSPTEHWAGFVGLMAFTGIFFFVFTILREQACTVICPYGRLQSVLLDKKSIVVIYDWLRGEPRGKIKKSEAQTSKGDCIDCNLCVHVCPTGIDIRNGTQLECVNCTACMDACDEVMLKINKPKGLIRYDSHEGVADKKTFSINLRVLAYSGVLLLLIIAFVSLLITRSDVEATLTKVRGTTYQQEDEWVSNLYNLQMVNKTFADLPIELKLLNDAGEIVLIGTEFIMLKAQEKAENTLFVKIPQEQINVNRQDIQIEVYANQELIETITTSFVGPVRKKSMLDKK